MSVCSCTWVLRLCLCVWFCGFFLRKKAFGFSLALCMSEIPFPPDCAVCQRSLLLLWWLWDHTSCSLPSFAPGAVFSWAVASKGTVPLAEANVALGVRECLCFHCCCNVFHLLQTCPSASSNSGRLKVSWFLGSTFAIKSKRDSWFKVI